MTADALQECQSPPQLALAFSTPAPVLQKALAAKLPNDTVVLGSMSQEIQVVNGPNHCDFRSKAALMLLAGLPAANTTIQSFCLEDDNAGNLDDEDLFDEDENWKMFIIYACDGHMADIQVKRLQTRFPNATIVGGVCRAAFVSVLVDKSQTVQDYYDLHTSMALLQLNTDLGGSDPGRGITKRELAEHVHAVAQTRKYRLKNIQEGLCGVALAGNVPVRSVVSRGVKSLMDVHAGLDGTPRPQTSLYVHQAETKRPGDPGYMFQGEDLPMYHLIRQVQDTSTGQMYSPQDLLLQAGRFPDYIGLRAPDQDGFTLESPHPISQNLNSWLIVNEDLESLEGLNFDIYALSGEASLKDMENCMGKLLTQTEEETVLGALMFSCNGRGPRPGAMLGEEMADAKRFAKVFPHVPCLGFYAGGEIGPCALAGRQAVFQEGKACLQGFTAVFALFIVPKVDLAAIRLDDCKENIDAFIRSQLDGGSINNDEDSEME